MAIDRDGTESRAHERGPVSDEQEHDVTEQARGGGHLDARARRSGADQRRLDPARRVADVMGGDIDDELCEAVDEVVDEDSRARRAHPLGFWCEVIEPVRDSDIDGFLKIWRTKATYFRWYADDAMYCLERVLADPPADLIERIRQRTGFVLNHVTPSEVTRYSHADKMRAIYDETAKK